MDTIINNNVAEILERSKKMDLCDTLNTHNAGDDGICKSCGMIVDPHHYVYLSDRTLTSLFHFAMRSDMMAYDISNIQHDSEKRDYSLNKYIDAGKYIIDSIKENTKGARRMQIIAALFGYINKDKSDGITRDEYMMSKLFDRALMTRYTINYMRLSRHFDYRDYDKEQIDELIFFDENIPMLSEFHICENIAVDSEYFSKKMSELYKEKKFGKLKNILSLIVNTKIFKSVDSRFIPFLSPRTLYSIYDKRVLAEYKNEILEMFKYHNEDVTDSFILKLVVRLAKTNCIEKRSNKMIKLIKQDKPGIELRFI